MSSVTNVIILAHCGDERCIEGINQLFKSGEAFSSIASAAGDKYVEAVVAVGAFNYLDRDALFAAIAGQEWGWGVQVLVKGQCEDRFQEFTLSPGGSLVDESAARDAVIQSRLAAQRMVIDKAFMDLQEKIFSEIGQFIRERIA